MTNESVTIRDVFNAVSELREEIRSSYVTKDEFYPVKAIVFGGAGIVLISVLTALLYLVVDKSV